MPYLLDGNNLIGTYLGASRPSQADRQALVQEIADRLRRTRARATIVFDGPAGERLTGLGALTVRVAEGRSADDEIVAAVERSRAPGELTVVTGDRQLASRVKDAGGKVVTPVAFFERFGASGGAGVGRKGAGAVDVEEWMRYFEDERNRG